MNKTFKAFTLGIATSALVATGAISSPAQAAPGDQATILVSKTTGLNPDGETITITGSGFLENAPLTNGTRRPLSGIFSGFYVSFGKFQDTWKPSTGAPSGNRKSSQSDVTRTKWLLPAASVNSVGGSAGGAFELPADGSFSITLNVSKALSSASGNLIFDESTIGNYGIYTYGASGSNYAPFENFTPISFLKPADPVVAAAPSEKLKAKVSNKVMFAGGSPAITRSIKRELKKEIANYKIASKVTITSTAGSTAAASDKVVKALAKKRANAIKKYLVAQGVSAENIVIKTKIAKPGKKPSTKVVATA